LQYTFARNLGAMNPPDETRAQDQPALMTKTILVFHRFRLLAIGLGFVLLFIFYLDGLSTNPPGFYVDESAIAYNAYCIAHTGANEFGTRFPLFFPVYTDGWTQYANPTQIYLLAIPFTFLKPSIVLARRFAAT